MAQTFTRTEFAGTRDAPHWAEDTRGRDPTGERGLRFVRRFGSHLDRVYSMFASFRAPPRVVGASSGLDGRPADAADVEGRPVRGDPTGLPRRPVRAGVGPQVSGQPPHGPLGSDVGVAGAAQADAASAVQAGCVQAGHRRHPARGRISVWTGPARSRRSSRTCWRSSCWHARQRGSPTPRSEPMWRRSRSCGSGSVGRCGR